MPCWELWFLSGVLGGTSQGTTDFNLLRNGASQEHSWWECRPFGKMEEKTNQGNGKLRASVFDQHSSARELGKFPPPAFLPFLVTDI